MRWLVLALCLGAALARPALAQAPGEMLIPLGAAQITQMSGATAARRMEGGPARELRAGDRTGTGEQVETGPGSLLELRFPDGTLVRLGPGTQLALFPEERRAVLRRGRILVQADRMLGGFTILTEQAAFVPEGTTFIVETAPRQRLTVLEGAVCLCDVSKASGPPSEVLKPRDIVVLSGEAQSPGETRPTPIPLLLAEKNEPLILAFARPLPSLAKIYELGDQQRRRVLPGRNARLRREIFWKRPARAPLHLPDLLGGPPEYRRTYVFPPGF